MKKLFTIMLLVLALGFITNGSAQGLGLKAIAPQLGLVMPEDPWDMGFHIGAKVNMGELAENLGLYPFLGYWSTKYSYSELGLSEDMSLSNIQIGADAHYKIASAQGLYVGGGLSFNILSVDVPYYNYFTGEVTTKSDSESKIGIGLLAGYELPLGSNLGFIQGKYNIISDFNTVELTVGMYFNLGK
jgi:opacity protein-like surface antigen